MGSRHTSIRWQSTNGRIIIIAWHATVHGLAKSQTWLSGWITANRNCRKFAQGVIGLSPTLSAPAQGSYSRRKSKSPQGIWLWSSMELVYGKARGLLETKPLLSKGVHTTSHTPQPCTHKVTWKEPWSEPFTDFGKPPGETGGKCNSPRDTHVSRSHFGQIILPRGHCCCKGHLESFSLTY